MTINELKRDLAERGFIETAEAMYEYAEGSISNYKKLRVCLGYAVWGDMAQEWFYSVRYESFAESGQPEIDHHTVTERYMTTAQVVEFLRDKGILTRAERVVWMAERKARWEELKRKRMMRG